MATGSVVELADYLINGYWAYAGGNANQWASHTITYNLDGTTGNQNVAINAALAAWSRMANVTFTFGGAGADITFRGSGPGTGASTSASYDADGNRTQTTITVDREWGGQPFFARGSYGYETMIHELGHALGLGHQGPYNAGDGRNPWAVRLWDNDTRQYSIMSYNAQSNFDGASNVNVATPMLADIFAIQLMYGANPNAALGNTTYGWHVSVDGYALYDGVQNGVLAPSFTIYDRGGTDTFDVSGSTFAATIDLRAGVFSSVAGLVNNVGIAYGTVLEEAIGTIRGDTIGGNGAANRLYGGQGGDLLEGREGADYLDGGDGFDTASYYDNAGATIQLWQGYAIDGTGAIDTLVSIENVNGSAFADGIVGDSGDNILRGLGGNDLIEGQLGRDFIDGGDGADTVSYFDNGAVVVDLGAGVATDAGGSVDSLVSIENVNGSAYADVIAGSAGANVIRANAGDDRLAPGLGGDEIDGGGGVDTVSYAGGGAVSVYLWLGYAYDGGGFYDSLASIENVEGGDLADGIAGDGGANILKGGGGNDLLEGQGGADRLDGGAGNDTISYFDNAGARIFLDRGFAIDGTGARDSLRSIENVNGSAYADRIAGNERENQLRGNGGADVFELTARHLGRDYILDFQDGKDRFDVADTMTFKELGLSRLDADGDGAVDDVRVNLGSPGKIDILNTSLSAIDRHDFLF